jgi:hypothetical protein
MEQARARERVAAEAMKRFITDSLMKVGLPAGDAAKAAELMLEDDLTGADAHGVFRLPQYVRRLRGGGINATPNIWVEKTAAATALVDGDNGMGHLVMARAAETAVELARASGVGWVGARRSNHAGAAGVYAALPLQHGMIGIYSVVASANHMAPRGGIETLLGTNPLAIAIPAGEEAPVVLDIATTVVSYGTVKKRLQGKEMPPGWMMDKRMASRSPIPHAAPKACSIRSAVTKAAGWRWCSVCLPVRSIARPSAAMCSISTTTMKLRATQGTSSSRSMSRGSRLWRVFGPRSTGICTICACRGLCRVSMLFGCRAASVVAVALTD